MTTASSDTNPARPPLERRGLADGAQLTADAERPLLCGYALRFGVRSEPLNGPNGAAFVEEIAPTALGRLTQRRDIKFLHSHDPSKVLGSTRAGTLRLTPDSHGLRFELTPPDSPSGHDLVESVRRGDVDAMSFAFKTITDEWRSGTTPPVRMLTDIDIFEISAVSWGAYAAAGIAIEQRAREHAAALVCRQGREQRCRELDALSARLAAIR
jgi:HK97 family phage prohead protease